MNDQPNKERTAHELKFACEMMLKAVGEDGQREGLRGTPTRFANMFLDLTSGYNQDPHGTRPSLPARDCKWGNIS